jgi:hypothetical protein
MSCVFFTLHVRFYFPDIATFCDLLCLTLIRELVELSTNINQGSVYNKRLDHSEDSSTTIRRRNMNVRKD